MINNGPFFIDKPFFLPWQKSDVPFDSILGISLTVSVENAKVYLSVYEKTPGKVKLGFTCNDQHLTYVESYLDEGINTIQLPSTELLVQGVVIVSDTNVTETATALPLQISPLYVTTASSYIDVLTFKVNDKDVVLNNCIIAFDPLMNTNAQDGDVYVGMNSQSNTATTITDDIYNDHIISVNGVAVDENNSATIVFPSYFTLRRSGDRSTLNITGNTNDTCTKYNIQLEEAIFKYTKHVSYPLPLDICVTRSGKFDTSVIKTAVFTDENLEWNELSRRHGDTK